MKSPLAISIVGPLPRFIYFLSNYNVLFFKIVKIAEKKITLKYVKQVGASYYIEFSAIHWLEKIINQKWESLISNFEAIVTNE